MDQRPNAYFCGAQRESDFLWHCIYVEEAEKRETVMYEMLYELGGIITVKILTSCLPRTSSTRARGFPLGTGMVPSIEQLEASKVCLTDRMNA